VLSLSEVGQLPNHISSLLLPTIHSIWYSVTYTLFTTFNPYLIWLPCHPGNSDEETDDKEMFDTRLSSIAQGQVRPDWDILFFDGEPGTADDFPPFMNELGNNKNKVNNCNN